MTQRYGSKVLALFHESQGASDAGVWGLFVFNFAFYWANDFSLFRALESSVGPVCARLMAVSM